MKLEDSVFLISGAGSGLGAAVAAMAVEAVRARYCWMSTPTAGRRWRLNWVMSPVSFSPTWLTPGR